MAARVVLQCGDCGTLLKSPEEAQHHAKNTHHTNYRESYEAILNLVCTVCGKTCSCRTIYLETENWGPEINQIAGPVISKQEKDWMQRHFEEQEVFDCMKHCVVDKAPRPDRFNMGYYVHG